jgi:hypothetical protein
MMVNEMAKLEKPPVAQAVQAFNIVRDEFIFGRRFRCTQQTPPNKENGAG